MSSPWSIPVLAKVFQIPAVHYCRVAVGSHPLENRIVLKGYPKHGDEGRQIGCGSSQKIKRHLRQYLLSRERVRIEGIRGIEWPRISLTGGAKPNWDAHITIVLNS
jgi:hypothetical protein